jgi:hypothetical protein
MNEDFARNLGVFTNAYDMSENKWEEIGPPVQRKRKVALIICFLHFFITVLSQVSTFVRFNIVAVILNFAFMGVIALNTYGLLRL